MIIHEVEQGSPEWLKLRSNIPTASEFSKLLSPTGKPSVSAKGLARLCAAAQVGVYPESVVTAAMDRGKALEFEARAYYQAQFAPVTQVGFISDQPMGQATCGCSPDGLVGKEGMIEIKCPQLGKFLEILEKGECPTEHLPQIQGSLMITKREWCDFVAYHPGMPLFVKRVFPDLEFQAQLAEQIKEVILWRDQFYLRHFNGMRP